MSKTVGDNDKVIKRKISKKLVLQSNVKPNKLQLCTYYIKGRCKHGSYCHFKHSTIPITKKKLCWYFISGKCSKSDCQYSHEISKFPCRYLNTVGFCRNLKECRFSHELIKTEQEREEFVRENKDYLLLPHKDGGPSEIHTSHMWWVPLLKKIIKEEEELTAKHSFIKKLYYESETSVPKGICSSIESNRAKIISNSPGNIHLINNSSENNIKEYNSSKSNSFNQVFGRKEFNIKKLYSNLFGSSNN
ncbi:CCCH RNA binding domain-containing protein [Cryptosporidium ubiquitum]|uniref:CCCH RNA binding domain-containing protein n=1 Tax=Cryptosporidium ubiquitum TaxID=857276 RepID=A0A1J4MCV6_9CRYT|nr:CCCH RNA binding domain-containing protein [Cryptosporidium ubiquitum]OII71323.1 CCCH RNA binding domain-containing protein [Cryptosporidium ubiquitum]